MSPSTGIEDCLEAIRSLARRLAERLSAEGLPYSEVELASKLFGTIMGAHLSHLSVSPDHPVFLPGAGFYQRYGSPNPDTVYRTAAIDGDGRYRLCGHRGSVPDVSITPFGRTTAGGIRTFPPFDLDDLEVDGDGAFEVSLARQRPPRTPNWWPLDPEMRSLMLRSVSDSWGEHVEPRLAIVRLDARPVPDEAALVARRLGSLATVVEGMMTSGINRVLELRAAGVVNRLVDVDYSQSGARAAQWYQEGCFALGADHVLLVEARLPPGPRRYSLSLTDALFSTLDWGSAQCSLNGRQAVVDPDGTLRVVLAASDPGWHNWLDTGGRGFGVLQCRWMGGTEAPPVSVRVLPTGELPARLPAGAPRITLEARAEAIRDRQIGVQLRSRL